MKVEESYGYVQFAADADGLVIGLTNGGSIGGFLCQTSGTIKLNKDTSGGATIVDTLAVTAGIFYPIPLAVPPAMGVYATLAGGAAGTFFCNQ